MAIGARSFDVLFQFLTQAVMVCFIGGLPGVVVGIGGVLSTSAIAGWRVIFTVAPVVIAFGCAFLTGIIFGYLPARKARNSTPSRRWPAIRNAVMNSPMKIYSFYNSTANLSASPAPGSVGLPINPNSTAYRATLAAIARQATIERGFVDFACD